MSLDVSILEKKLFNVFEKNSNISDASNDIAKAIIDYTKSASLILAIPGLNPAGVNDPSFSPPLTVLEVNSALASGGVSIMTPIIESGLSANDEFNGLTIAIKSYIATLIVWGKAPGYLGTVTIVPSQSLVSGYFSADLNDIKNNNKTKNDAARQIANKIHLAFTSSFATGTATNSGGFISVITSIGIT